MYLKQVEALLCLLASCRSGDLDAYVAAAENNIKYPFFFDLHHYSRLIPVHIQEMKEIKRNDPILWNELSVNFSVNNTGIPFCNLFGDRALEQHIKKLKDSGCLLGLTESPETLQRLMFTSPFLGKIVNEFRNKTPPARKRHYQLSGSYAPRFHENVKKMQVLICSVLQPFPKRYVFAKYRISAEIPGSWIFLMCVEWDAGVGVCTA